MQPRRPRLCARANLIADLAERVEMLAEDAHQNDENHKLVAHLYSERDTFGDVRRNLLAVPALNSITRTF